MIRVISDKFDIKYSLQSVASGHANDKTIREEYDNNIEVNFIGFLSKLHEIYLIQIDTLFVEESLKNDIQDALQKNNITVTIICIASHSHSLPSIDSGKPLLGPINPEFIDFIKSKIINQIKSCTRLENSANVNFANFLKKNKLSIGRRGNHSGANFSLIKLRKTVPDYSKLGANIEVTTLRDINTNKLNSVIWTFPAHPVLNPHNSKFSSDYPGEVRDLIRTKMNNPNLPILYFPGCTGDMKSFIVAKKKLLDYLIGQPFAKTNETSYKAYCKSLEVELFECVNSSQFSKKNKLESIDHNQIKIPLSEIGIKNKVNNSLIVDSIYFNNKNRFLLMNCEPSNNYSSLLGPDCTVSGYTSGVFGYLPTDQQIKQGGYEVSGFMQYFGTSGSFKTNTEKIVTAIINNAHSPNKSKL